MQTHGKHVFAGRNTQHISNALFAQMRILKSSLIQQKPRADLGMLEA